MNDIEVLRKELHKALETGNYIDILKASQRLDDAILLHMKDLNSGGKKSA